MLNKLFGFFARRKNPANTDKLVMVVDDGEVERKFMERTLTGYGYRVLLAKSGEEAIELAREHKPDLIFLDFLMIGGMDGQEACKRIKSESYAKDIPIVFLSGSVTPTKVIDCYDVGAEYFLSKPISAATLLEHTRLLLEDAQLSKEQTSQQQQQ